VVKGNNAYQDAAQLARQFGIDVSFGAACLLVTVPLGAAVGLRWQRLGWPIVVVLVVAAALASGIAWQLGATFGAADPSTLIDTAADGDRLYAPLELQARGVLVSAPVGALVGFIAAMVIRPTHPVDPPRSQLDRTASRSGRAYERSRNQATARDDRHNAQSPGAAAVKFGRSGRSWMQP
jgi:hypothetical protein